KVFIETAPSRLDPLPVNALVDDHGIPRRGDIRRPPDGEKGMLLRSGVLIAPRLCNMIDMRHCYLLNFRCLSGAPAFPADAPYFVKKTRAAFRLLLFSLHPEDAALVAGLGCGRLALD